MSTPDALLSTSVLLGVAFLLMKYEKPVEVIKPNTSLPEDYGPEPGRYKHDGDQPLLQDNGNHKTQADWFSG